MQPHDEIFMQYAINLARLCRASGGRPFGCVIIDEDHKFVGSATGSGTDAEPTRHSEMIAIERACAARGGLLHGCAIYSTHEPCAMCAGAMVHAKPDRVIFGSWRHDLSALFKARKPDLAYMILRDHSRPIEVVDGVCRQDCIDLFADELWDAAA